MSVIQFPALLRIRSTALAALLCAAVSAQTPYVQAPHFDAQAVAQDDEQRALAGDLPLYGRLMPIDAIPATSGSWAEEGRDRVWRVGITSPGALAVECFLDQAVLPPGASFQMTSPSGRPIGDRVHPDLAADVHEFSTALVPGDSLILEYREPVNADFQGTFRIAQIGHAYRDVEFDASREGTCHVNVACHPESDGWEGPIRATVRISVVVSQGTGWCSGTLVNNVRQDCAPYILSAWHCGRTSTTAQFNQYKFYFNFQYATCTGGSYSTAQYVTGSQLKAYSDDYAPEYQGLGGSDFMLLRTNATIPSSFQPYWAGWDATNISSVTADGVCIHHPTGAPKRISSYAQTLVTGHPMASSGLMSHYKVVWAQTEHGWGITEVGSSGSGLFKQISGTGPVLIGTNTGSSSGMSCSNHSGYAYFGKMSYHWTNNPNAANIKLKPWLDPDNTGTLVLAGSDQPCAAASAIGETALRGQTLLYPNPATDRVFLSGMGPVHYQITDLAGHILRRGKANEEPAGIDLAGLACGLYILTAITDQGVMARQPFTIAP